MEDVVGDPSFGSVAGDEPVLEAPAAGADEFNPEGPLRVRVLVASSPGKGVYYSNEWPAECPFGLDDGADVVVGVVLAMSWMFRALGSDAIDEVHRHMLQHTANSVQASRIFGFIAGPSPSDPIAVSPNRH